MLVSSVNAGGYAAAASAQPQAAPAPPASIPAPQSANASGQAAASAPQPTAQQLKTAVDQANKAAQNVTSDVEFSVDNTTGIRIVKVVNTQTQQVIRQMPAQEIIDMAQSFEKSTGLIIQQKA